MAKNDEFRDRKSFFFRRLRVCVTTAVYIKDVPLNICYEMKKAFFEIYDRIRKSLFHSASSNCQKRLNILNSSGIVVEVVFISFHVINTAKIYTKYPIRNSSVTSTRLFYVKNFATYLAYTFFFGIKKQDNSLHLNRRGGKNEGTKTPTS